MAVVAIASQAFLSVHVWAAGIGVPGVPNFYQINDRVYRGGQPTDDGWNSLAKLGIKTVIDLRLEKEHSGNAEKQAVEAAGMRYVSVPLDGLGAPPNEQISKLLALLNGSAGPVFVHCRRGADRTGTVIACYRIAHDGWNNRKALQEAKSDGMAWFEFGMHRYVLGFHPGSAAADLQSAPLQANPPQPAAQSATLN